MSSRGYGYRKRKRYGDGYRRSYNRSRKYSSAKTYYKRHNLQAGTVPNGTRGWDWKAAEKKFIDTAISGVAQSNPVTPGVIKPSLYLCNGVLQGTDYNQRIGREFRMCSWHIRLNFSQNANYPISQVIRVMLVYDKQPNAVQVLSSDILRAVSALVNVQSFNNLDNRDRFKVLYDKNIQMNANGSGITLGPLADNNYRTKFKKCWLPVVNNNTGTAIGSITTGAMWLLLIGNYAAPPIPGTDPDYRPNVEGQVRIRFYDY